MKEVCLPFTDLKDNEIAEVEIRISERKRVLKYRIESFALAPPEKKKPGTNEKINLLREMIKAYDPDWELIQILDSNEGSNYVQLLYRYKK